MPKNPDLMAIRALALGAKDIDDDVSNSRWEGLPVWAKNFVRELIGAEAKLALLQDFVSGATPDVKTGEEPPTDTPQQVAFRAWPEVFIQVDGDELVVDTYQRSPTAAAALSLPPMQRFGIASHREPLRRMKKEGNTITISYTPAQDYFRVVLETGGEEAS